MKITKVKKTGKIVQKMGTVDGKYTLCLFPLEVKTRNGNYGTLQVVKTSNLVEDGVDYIMMNADEKV